jgi:hypothetical protein
MELLKNYNEALEKHISFLESQLEQCKKEHGGLREFQLHPRPMMPPISSPGSEVDMDEEEWPTDSSSDTDGDADIEQLVAPMKRLVVRFTTSNARFLSHLCVSGKIASWRQPPLFWVDFSFCPRPGS